jgi:hypothetical protein
MRDVHKIVIERDDTKPMSSIDVHRDVNLAYEVAQDHGEKIGMSNTEQNTIIVKHLAAPPEHGDIKAVYCTRGGPSKCVLYQTKEG